MKLVYGVGINDADYNIQLKEELPRVDGKRKQKVLWTCPFYRKWKGMLERCYCPKFKVLHPTYEGCAVDTIWHRFSNFKAWMISQPWENMQLDKDVLVRNSKIYSPHTCAFLPSDINTILLLSDGNRGKLPVGVSYLQKSSDMNNELINCFKATIRDRHLTQDSIGLGVFATAQLAHTAWQKGKADIIDKRVQWWASDASVNHTFRSDVAEALWAISNKLRSDAQNGVLTENF